MYGSLLSTFLWSTAEEEAHTCVKKAVSHAMARDGSSGGVIRTVVVKESGNAREYVPGNALPFGP